MLPLQEIIQKIYDLVMIDVSDLQILLHTQVVSKDYLHFS